MNYENPLDHAIHRFQHRWETDRQFRAGMSGVLGLLLVFVLCTGVGALDLAATRVLAAVGINAPVPGVPNQPNTDTGVIDKSNGPLYTPTVPTWSVPVIPQASPNPTSPSNAPTAVPTPTPTDVPTRPPCNSNCGGGPTVVITAYPSPSRWTQTQQASIHFHVASLKDGSPLPNHPINAFIHWANGATWLSTSTPGAPQATDGAGNATWTITVPGPFLPPPRSGPDYRCTGTVKVDYDAYDPGVALLQTFGTELSLQCGA